MFVIQLTCHSNDAHFVHPITISSLFLVLINAWWTLWPNRISQQLNSLAFSWLTNVLWIIKHDPITKIQQTFFTIPKPATTRCSRWLILPFIKTYGKTFTCFELPLLVHSCSVSNWNTTSSWQYVVTAFSTSVSGANVINLCPVLTLPFLKCLNDVLLITLIMRPRNSSESCPPHESLNLLRCSLSSQ